MSCSAVAGDQLDCICGKTGRYELNSPFHYALLRLAAELPNSTASSSELFTTATVGEVPEAVVAGATCRRDADASLCKDCVLAALKEGMQTCVYDKSVTVYTDHCTIRYSNEDFIAEGFRDFNWFDDYHFFSGDPIIRLPGTPELQLHEQTAKTAATINLWKTVSDLSADSILSMAVLQGNLQNDRQRQPLLGWEKRLRIIGGVADGLLYLHKHSRVRVIHWDLKSSNILLDKELSPKISDFGLAKIFRPNTLEGNSKRVVGTLGYIAPECSREGTFSVKSDVYSFGVLVLEIIGGKRNSEFSCIARHAWQLWRDSKESELIDPALGVQGEVGIIVRYIKVALLCVQDSAMDRPTMAEVIAMLAVRGDAGSLPEPRCPRQVSSSGVSTGLPPSGVSTDMLGIQTQSRHTKSSINEVSITVIEGR
ncbi:hypothetical protein HU200_051296 [Digitaria exilis]|uniref:Uncharacterized protein n=1 Tax=Digitaria exilis TaxID=1010633 RepID=A0A835E9J9_9POAL|nr:hypothetical protein HU200_051296 [Digitaria exilis]